MHHIIKIMTLLFVFNLTLLAYADEKEFCLEVDKVMKESTLIYEKFDDAKNALVLLNGSNFRRILSAKPVCIEESVYLKYLEQYALYLSKIEEYNAIKQIEALTKLRPEYANFHKLLGDAYKRDYFKRNIPKSREMALESYQRYQECATAQHQKIEADVLEFITSGGLKKVLHSWGEQLNIAKEIPKNSYKAFYIDTTNPQNVVASEVVKDISVNYVYKDFHGIDSGHFGGYWVGNIEFKQDEKKVFYISFSNSKLRLIVDGYSVYEGQHNAEVPYFFTKGTHKIEVEYLNGWHTTSLVVKMLPQVEKYSLQDLKERLGSLEKRDYEVWYVGIYESKNKDNSVALKLKKSQKPIVLLLQSYEATTWKIENPYRTPLEAIILNSYAPEATVEGDVDKDVKILHSQTNIGSGYRLVPQCSCISGNFHCEGSTFKGNAFATALNTKVRGFSGKYGATELAVPEEIMDDAHYAELEKKEKEIALMRETCSKNKSANFDDIFQKK